MANPQPKTNPYQHRRTAVDACCPDCPACAYDRGWTDSERTANLAEVYGQLLIARRFQYAIDHHYHDLTGTEMVRRLTEVRQALEKRRQAMEKP